MSVNEMNSVHMMDVLNGEYKQGDVILLILEGYSAPIELELEEICFERQLLFGLLYPSSKPAVVRTDKVLCFGEIQKYSDAHAGDGEIEAPE